MTDAKTQKLQEASTKKILAGLSDPRKDIQAERARATFNVEELTDLYYGGRKNVERRKELVALLAQQPWADKKDRYFWTREEEYVRCVRAAFGIRDLVREKGLSVDDALILRQYLDLPGGLELHIGMFIPTLRGQATPEQQAKWLKPSLALELIGTYAQTELGHGTFVRGLETTATYDKDTQEFVVHSPTLTATKWWPGGLAKTSSHAVVMARLFIEGKDYGPHPFVMQLRDMKTHKPLPGVTVGDIGPKFGFNGVDNGFLRFDHVRIPRDHLLMKYAKVTPEGKYVPPPPGNEKAAYGTMVFVRATIVRDAGIFLARAATIATRYLAVRRQTMSTPGSLETQVLDFANTQAVVLPSIASSYCLHFMGQAMMNMYEDSLRRGSKGDFSTLPELHALSSGLKALCTDIASGLIETCRRTCGGHGFSQLSALPHAYQYYVQNVTWEGENAVMYLQAARYLVKNFDSFMKGTAGSLGQDASSSVAYLRDAPKELSGVLRCPVSVASDWRNPMAQLQAIKHAAIRLLSHAVTELMETAGPAAKSVPLEGPVWNKCTVSLIKAAKAHGHVALVSNFIEVVAGLPGGPLHNALAATCDLFALSTLETYTGVLLEDGYMTGHQAALLRKAIAVVQQRLRPDAVALVDAFAFDDYYLNSALGKEDGDVYKALYDMAQRSPLNRTEEGPAWESVIRPGRGANGSVTGPAAIRSKL